MSGLCHKWKSMFDVVSCFLQYIEESARGLLGKVCQRLHSEWTGHVRN